MTPSLRWLLARLRDALASLHTVQAAPAMEVGIAPVQPYVRYYGRCDGCGEEGPLHPNLECDLCERCTQGLHTLHETYAAGRKTCAAP